MANYHHPDEDFLRKLGVAPPSVSAHATDEEISKNMKKLKPSSWRQEGNWLIGQTDMGELRQTVPTSHILTGTDDSGNPIFKRIDI